MDTDLQGPLSNSAENGNIAEKTPMSFRDRLMRNSPHLEFSSYSNPCWNEEKEDWSSEEEDNIDTEDDPNCLVIKLSKEQKKRMRAP